MPKLIYCTYLTVYTGNKLPPFYIGSTSMDKINKGYRGSVDSKKYKSIWKQELYDHPDLFKTIILTKHETRQEALDKEIVFHVFFSVARNPMYINMAHANGKFLSVGPKSPEHIAKISAAHTGKTQSPEHIAKGAAARTGIKRHNPRPQISQETRNKLIISHIGKTPSPETKAKMSAAQKGISKPISTQNQILGIQKMAIIKTKYYYNLIHVDGMIEVNISVKELAIKYPQQNIHHSPMLRGLNINGSYKAWTILPRPEDILNAD